MRALALLLLLTVDACGRTNPRTLAIRGTTIVDVTDGSLRGDYTVLIANNRVVAVGPADLVTIPNNAEVIDAAGSYLIPGLWDMHVHSVANIAVDMNVRSVAAHEWHFAVFLAYGITGVRNMNDGTGDPTLRLTNSVKRRLSDASPRGPRFIANGPSLDGDPPLGSNSAVVRSAAEARAIVDTLVAHRADFIKVYENLPRDAYFTIMDQARRRGVPVDGHVPFRVRPEEAADAGQRTFEHVLAMAAGCSTNAEAERERFARVLSPRRGAPALESLTPMTLFHHERTLYHSRNPAACTATIDAYRRNGVAEAPNIVAYHDVVRAKEILSDTAIMRFVPEAIRSNWNTMLESEIYPKLKFVLQPMVPLYAENARLLYEAGVVLLAATDVGLPAVVPGVSLHEELALLVEAGLTPLASLQTATLNPARVLGMADSLGTVEVGKLADLVLLDANPLADIRNTLRIRAVVADGQIYTSAELEQLAAQVSRSLQRRRAQE